jgi:hypothetical protein
MARGDYCGMTLAQRAGHCSAFVEIDECISAGTGELDQGPICRPMSALGQKRTFRWAIGMSALPPKADIIASTHVGHEQ